MMQLKPSTSAAHRTREGLGSGPAVGWERRLTERRGRVVQVDQGRPRTGRDGRPAKESGPDEGWGGGSGMEDDS